MEEGKVFECSKGCSPPSSLPKQSAVPCLPVGIVSFKQCRAYSGNEILGIGIGIGLRVVALSGTKKGQHRVVRREVW